MKGIFATLGILAAVALLAWYALGKGPADFATVPEGFVRYENIERGFSLLRPEDSTVHQEGPEGEIIKILFLGPEALPNTEITDGFTLTVQGVEGASSLESLAEREIATMQTNGGELLSALEQTQVGGMMAYKYSYRTVLGNTATAHVFLGPEEGFVVTTSIIDPGNRGYEGMVELMLESWEFYPS